MKNDFQMFYWVAPSQGVPRVTYFFLPPLPKTLKSTVFELEWWFVHVNRSVFHQELNREGPMVPGVHYFTKKWQIYYPNFQHPKIQNNLDLGFDMIWPFWPFIDHKIHQTQSTWGHTTNFSPIRPTLTGGCSMPTQVGVNKADPHQNYPPAQQKPFGF